MEVSLHMPNYMYFLFSTIYAFGFQDGEDPRLLFQAKD